jgi:hypothetical protein
MITAELMEDVSITGRHRAAHHPGLAKKPDGREFGDVLTNEVYSVSWSSAFKKRRRMTRQLPGCAP